MHTTVRNRLGVERLLNLIFVSLVGPSLDYFNALPYVNKNLSGRKQIARQLRRQYMYVEGIYRPKYYTVTLKTRLSVTQCHWKRYRWIDHTRLTISRVIWRWILSWSWNVCQRSLKSLKVVPFESLGTISNSPFIVTMAVSLAILEIFSLKEWPDLEIWVWVFQGHWKWRGSIDHVWLFISLPL